MNATMNTFSNYYIATVVKYIIDLYRKYSDWRFIYSWRDAYISIYLIYRNKFHYCEMLTTILYCRQKVARYTSIVHFDLSSYFYLDITTGISYSLFVRCFCLTSTEVVCLMVYSRMIACSILTTRLVRGGGCTRGVYTGEWHATVDSFNDSHGDVCRSRGATPIR